MMMQQPYMGQPNMMMQPNGMVQQPYMVQQPNMMMQPNVMMQPTMMMAPQPQVMVVNGSRRREKYCGPISWMIGIVLCVGTGLGPVVLCCPCDERDASY